MAQDNEYCLGAVPAKGRKGVLSLMLVMLGLTFFSASMWTGGALGTGLVFDDFIKAVLIGNLLLGIYTACLGYIGASTGLSTHLLARYSFGVKGSWLPSLLLGGTQVGWFGVGVAMFALPVQKATGIDVNWLIAISGMLMTVTVYFGISALMVLSFVAVPAIALLGGYSVWLAVTSTGGMAALQQVQPSNPIEFTTALTMVVGSFISAGTLTADFVRFGRKPWGAVMITMVAFFGQHANVRLRCSWCGGNGAGRYLGSDADAGAVDPRHSGAGPQYLDHQRQRALRLRPRFCQYYRSQEQAPQRDQRPHRYGLRPLALQQLCRLAGLFEYGNSADRWHYHHGFPAQS